jgi:hypothetical protein
MSYPPEPTIRPKPFPGNGAQRIILRRFSGWDRYDIWRTRVKAPRDPALDFYKVG